MSARSKLSIVIETDSCFLSVIIEIDFQITARMMSNPAPTKNTVQEKSDAAMSTATLDPEQLAAIRDQCQAQVKRHALMVTMASLFALALAGFVLVATFTPLLDGLGFR